MLSEVCKCSILELLMSITIETVGEVHLPTV